MTEVRVGQIWKDWDVRYRDEQPGRRLRIDAIVGQFAFCTIVSDSDCARVLGRSRIGRTARISLSRLKPTSTGYKLIDVCETNVRATSPSVPGTGTGRAATPPAARPQPSVEDERRLDLTAELTNGQLEDER